ncbi:hypothetical protein K457DRAFT_1820198 [Linnemannia elongata AG-77]|uniref:Uncharacterized protein n=1 Tax=Linnemannia elongata AG-77 TaxID=1314771 RepID=A0A197JWD6_9FUNG|nr:hypothetical protein K457DRAFT_1820198 [Linnemannia elongata AG-77]
MGREKSSNGRRHRTRPCKLPGYTPTWDRLSKAKGPVSPEKKLVVYVGAFGLGGTRFVVVIGLGFYAYSNPPPTARPTTHNSGGKDEGTRLPLTTNYVTTREVVVQLVSK